MVEVERVAVRSRVLHRFSYTEADADAQYDKLRSAHNVADWAEPLFNNRALFADYFLDQRLRERAEWAEDPKPPYRQLRPLYAGARERFGGGDETTVRAELIEPTLRALGFTGVLLKSQEQAPYYYSRAADEGGAARVFCLPYGWDRYLDGKDEQRDTLRPDENPDGALRRGQLVLVWSNRLAVSTRRSPRRLEWCGAKRSCWSFAYCSECSTCTDSHAQRSTCSAARRRRATRSPLRKPMLARSALKIK